VQFGSFEIVSLDDGTFRLDGGAMFGIIPKPLWTRRAAADERNRILLGIRPLLVRTGTHTVLIDAGIGDKFGPKDQEIYAIDRTTNLDRSLAAAGCRPEDIDLVVATHLHFDHAGGFTVRQGDEVVPRFPRARYLVRRGEWDDAMSPSERTRASYLRENFAPLLAAGVLDFREEDGEIVPGISVHRTGGHTRHHEIVRIQSQGRTAIFAADLIPTAAHVDTVWIAAYDLYPLEQMAYKKQFVEDAVQNEYVIFFEHDPELPAGIIRDDRGRKRIEPIAGLSTV
jgi:glyoxylase-like metal-dependent hydrolase (beta-lactamase superfamily II)